MPNKTHESGLRVLDETPVRAIGVDVGKVRVGVAVADELGLVAHPRPFVDGRDPKRAVDALAALAATEHVDRFVVGLPLTLRGSEGPPARRARRFAEALARRTGLAVELSDERFSTREARGRLREAGLDDRRARERVDSAAAAVVLQAWLDAHRTDEA
jgi:putative Holliday junction resolvase